jgi:Xaa-Pro aminopeptidase
MDGVIPRPSAASQSSAPMFQDFSDPADSGSTAERVEALRDLLSRRMLDAFLVPRADEHQGEYVPRSAERLRFITGFTGSAGSAVIARRSACLLTDGRYTIQAKAQVDGRVLQLRQVPEQKLSDWLIESLPASARVGFDPWLHTVGEIERLGEAVAGRKIKLVPVSRNLVDVVWGRDRPPAPLGPVIVQPLEHAGTSAEEKLDALRKKLKDDGQDAVVLTLPDSICWLLNIRGSDVAHNPVVLAFAIVPQRGKAELFVDPAKLDAQARQHLTPLARLCPAGPRSLIARLKELRAQGRKVRLDPETGAYAIARALGHASTALGRDPCIDPKARKSPAEIKGARAAHVRDGAAMVRYLAWLDENARSGELDEIEAVRQLETFRRASNLLREISFDTISGSGPNGAIVHYRVTEATNRRLRPGELLLIDSGAQYADGTTDVTRTVAIGEPTAEMRRRYTAVLKGHIAISVARFPAGTRGVELDAFARRALWEQGLDYDHGTGHGVGSYLSVHEGPASISKRGMVALEPGMILSNEPGYYKTGAYGIRIENLVLVEPGKVPPGGERAMHSFETLTLVPYDRRLIALGDLTAAERAFIDGYHARVAADIAPLIDDEVTRRWLMAATAPLAG